MGGEQLGKERTGKTLIFFLGPTLGTDFVVAITCTQYSLFSKCWRYSWQNNPGNNNDSAGDDDDDVDHDVDDEVPLQVERRCPPLRSNISEMFCRGPGPPPCLSALTASHYNKYTDTQKNTSIQYTDRPTNTMTQASTRSRKFIIKYLVEENGTFCRLVEPQAAGGPIQMSRSTCIVIQRCCVVVQSIVLHWCQY